MGNSPSPPPRYTIICGGCSETELYSGTSYQEYEKMGDSGQVCGKCKIRKEEVQNQRERDEAAERAKQREREWGLEKEREKERQREFEAKRKEKEKQKEREYELQLKRQEEEYKIQIENQKEAAERLKFEQEQNRKLMEMKQQKYEQEQKLKMEMIKNEEAKKQRAAKAEAERRKAQHEQQLKQMEIDRKEKTREKKIEQKNAAINRINLEVGKLDVAIKYDQKQLKTVQENLGKCSTKLDTTMDWINKFDTYKEVELNKTETELQLNDAKKKFEDVNDQIVAAINKTGQIENKIGEFLQLTHGLVGATMATKSNADKLDVEMNTFSAIIGRECQDELSIEHYFNRQRLTKFVSILSAEDFHTLSDLICQNEDEFNEDIVEVLENGVKEQLQLEHKNNDSDDDSDDDKKDEISAEQLLKDWKLSQFFSKMEDEGYDDVDIWDDLSDEELTEMGFKKGHVKKFRKNLAKYLKSKNKEKKSKLLTNGEIRQLKKICLQPETWKEYQTEKAKKTKEGLLVISPLMGEFFSKIHRGIKTSQHMLDYNNTLNNEQLEAIAMVHNLPPIEHKSDDNKDDNNKDNDNNKDEEEKEMDERQHKLRKQWKTGSKCEIYSDSEKRWFAGRIIKIVNDSQGEWLNVQYKTDVGEYRTKQIGRESTSIRLCLDDNSITVQCHALTQASIISIDVTDSMFEQFNKSSLTARALAVAKGVEDCCMRIMKSQGTIRRSVLLAQEILKHRPANISSNESKLLWDAVDNGIIYIFQSALEMIKISAQYFGFFLRFKQSFNYYSSMYRNNEDCSLMVSLEHLQKDIRDFAKFKANFDIILKKLSDDAMNCITNCVKTHIGATNFENHRRQREIRFNQYLEKKKIYDQKAKDLDGELDTNQQKRIHLSGSKVRLSYQVTTLKTNIENNKQLRDKYLEKKSDLNSMIIE